MVGLSIKFQRWWSKGDAELAEFWVFAGGGKIGSAVLQLSFEAQVTAVKEPWAVGRKDDADVITGLKQATLRLGIQRIAAILQQKQQISRAEPITIPVSTNDMLSLAKLVAEKTCSYQLSKGRDLYCSAASIQDETAVGQIDSRTVAPTSRPVCKKCDLPDTDYICAHLLHPQVSGVRQGPLVIRQMLTAPLCDVGSPHIQTPAACHAGGNPCWEYDVQPIEPTAIVPVASRALPDAFDHLDAIWRLAFKTPLLRVKRLADVAGLTEPCSTADEFKSRLSAMADVLNGMEVDDTLLLGTAAKPLADAIGIAAGTQLIKIPKEQSLNRLMAVIDQRLVDPEKDQATVAIKTLRAVRELRVAAQHAHAADRLPAALTELGLGFPVVNYGETWDRVRAKTIGALGTLRQAIDTLT